MLGIRRIPNIVLLSEQMEISKKNMELNATTHFKSELVEVELPPIQLGYHTKQFVAQRLINQRSKKKETPDFKKSIF